ncbi:hypothetical protein B0J11DRAFT_453410 [Dendryphion nanum]|uniref:Fe2OG dioxygenase domain-containing protein n=1 Tax=Dendryphion nanum TaxID=256645 RepID=A0A9P9IY32_9PLEO|nr:hypothetical protein B0J11DRAFT_453410 [Dendryphion nanum]
MMSLLDLISQNQPHFQTHQALLVIGLQNDFIQPDAKLPVDTHNGFLDRIDTIIPKFRQLSANIIWVKTVYETDRTANDPATGEGDAVVVGGLADGIDSSTDDEEDLPRDLIPAIQSRSSRHKQRALDLFKRVSARKPVIARKSSQLPIEEDEELFLLKSSRNGAACLPDTPGVEFIDAIKPRIEPKDTVLQTSNYSAFLGTSLLLILRAKLVTELYICGCITNVSVLASVIDAARHGIRINVLEDCLGYRKQNRHDEALRRMVDFFDANIVTSQDILRRNPLNGDNAERPVIPHLPVEVDDELENLVENLHLGNASVAESRTTTDTKLSDEQFADMLVQGAKVVKDPNAPVPAAKPNMVKSRIRMRTRNDKSKKDDEKKSRAEGSKKGETDSRGKAAEAATPATVPSVKPSTSTPKAPPRSAAIAKAESSDRLRESKPEQALKSSASQPALSSASLETKILKSPSSLARLALSRSAKSDSAKSPTPQPSPQPSPTKLSAETSSTKSHPPTKPMAPTNKKLQSLANLPVLRPGDRIAEGDSRVIYDFFPCALRHPSDLTKPLKDLIFIQLYNEVRWQKMLHQQGEVPRLVCCQGEFGSDGSMPVYRHPTDQALPLLHFSPKVEVIRRQAEKLVGHALNHVLIQLYRSGQDYISEHSDKTLDIVRGSSIVNVSFGAQRTMRLRTKKSAKPEATEEVGSRETQRVAMPHNSMFVLGLESNKKWLHGINADKRIEAERSEEERAYSGARISLTFRHIGTFLDAENSTIWGQGATGKKQNDAQDVINDDEEENEKIVRAFSKENHQFDFDWEDHYGDGFDVLHFRNAPEDMPILFASNNSVENKMVQIFLSESKINHLLLEAPTLEQQYDFDRQVCYRDNDVNHTEVAIATPILLYLDRYYPLDRDDRGRASSARSYEIFVTIMTLLKFWVNRHVPAFKSELGHHIDNLEERLATGPGPFIAGRRFSIGDCAAWPALDELINNWEDWSEGRFPTLTEYYRMLWRKKKSVTKLRKTLPTIRKETGDAKEEDQKHE